LQEYCQAHKYIITYRQKKIIKDNKEKQQLFVMEVSDRLRTFCEQGTGKSKKEAEQEAASKVINKLGIGKEKKE